MLFDKKIIVFGASTAGRRMEAIVRNLLRKDIFCFVDNDPKKWGKQLLGKDILSSESLQSMDPDEYAIIIASMYADEISIQLDQLGMEYNKNYYFMEEAVLKFLEWHYNQYENVVRFKNKLNNEAIIDKNPQKLLIVLPNGCSVGGLETWSRNLFLELLRKNKNCYILNLNPKSNELDFGKINMLDFEFDYYDYIHSLEKLALFLYKYSPVTVIPNTSEEVMLVCKVLELAGFHRQVKILSVIHSDLEYSFKQYQRFEKYTKKFICVSEEIEKKVKKFLPSREKDIYSKPSPIPRTKCPDRTYSESGQPIVLGYAARLVKKDKRSHDIIPFLELLEKENVSYEFHIAGDGECFKDIYHYVQNHNLISKVKLYGRIPNDEMFDFWLKKDIFLNFSEREGTSISMLEALSNGAVPVLTNVSGVKTFVEHGENGFIVEPRELDKMVEYIKYLYSNRDLLEKMGEKCVKKINDHCSLEEYADFIWECASLG